MNVFFTSDHHFSHRRICELASRPFSSWEEMDEVLVENWNSVVGQNDEVWVLGDFAMGKISESLLITKRLNGSKKLVPGNHDRVFPVDGQQEEKWLDAYAEVGFEILPLTVEAFGFQMSHFPWAGDSHDEDRFSSFRPQMKDLPLLHGHVHEKWKVNTSRGIPMINVGVDVWNFAPVSIDVLSSANQA